MGVFLNENATERPLPYTHHQGKWSRYTDLPVGTVAVEGRRHGRPARKDPSTRENPSKFSLTSDLAADGERERKGGKAQGNIQTRPGLRFPVDDAADQHVMYLHSTPV